MSNSLDMQCDISNLTLLGLGSFTSVLSALSADDVQPIAMIQLEKLGGSFPISGPLRAQIPDHLQRCSSKRLESLGVTIGWRKGDAASLMSQSAGGQAVALLATCLENVYGNEAAATIFYKISKALLPNSARLSSPKQLQQATTILSRKLGVIGFGTILAKQICRIHDAYQHLPQKAPSTLLASLSQDGMCDILSKFSRAIQEDKCIVRVRGCASMGYITALAVVLFSDDCIVTVENLIIHQGCRSSSITIEITGSHGDTSLQAHYLGKIESLFDLPVKQAQLPHTLKFSSHAPFAAYMQLYLQEWGLLCSPHSLIAMGTCILSLSDTIFISLGGLSGPRPAVSTNFFSLLFGETFRASLRQRCETALGVTLPFKWPSFSEALLQLKSALAKSNHAKSFASIVEHASYRCDPSGALLRIIDEGVASMAVYVHEGATWQAHSDREIWYPSDAVQNQGAKQVTLNPSELLYKLFSWDDVNLVLKSEGTTTLVPSSILHLGSDLYDLNDNRGLELFDGLIFHQNRYHSQIFAEVDYNFWTQQSNQPCQKMSQAKAVCINREGAHSNLSLAIVEHVQGLALECSVTAGGQKQSINLRERVDQLFGLLDAYPCNHSRQTPLKEEYGNKVQTNSVLTPDGRPGDHISIVQTAGNPTAQFLSLTKWEPAILCRGCCLNCAYEQAREKEIYKIIVA
ncbi:uncharacterized protein N7443_004570 [Penicillium atrosanguineum]|uniref:uncharacterized protein n=1 Tax=Penicillium atrosanguineum TaxID=1132637 RepID=UPI002385484D|nr:uncharacterized protein N7443_004570 [Penicillium atrosanguineum]KAJ5304910.1 hypothetical protein N7443_004570 [Penicillium atrosanguineum]